LDNQNVPMENKLGSFDGSQIYSISGKIFKKTPFLAKNLKKT